MKKLSAINQKLIKAAQNNQPDELKNLLDQGADIHADDDEALKWAANNGHLEIVKFLITKGANIHADDDYALKWSAACGHLEVVKFLVTKRANIHASDDGALRLSSCTGKLETVKFLIAHGANIHADNDGALRWSAQNGYDDVWQVLSAFIQEEKLLAAASESTGASTWVCGTSASSFIPGVPILPQKITSVDVDNPQRLSIKKLNAQKYRV